MSDKVEFMNIQDIEIIVDSICVCVTSYNKENNANDISTFRLDEWEYIMKIGKEMYFWTFDLNNMEDGNYGCVRPEIQESAYYLYSKCPYVHDSLTDLEDSYQQTDTENTVYKILYKCVKDEQDLHDKRKKKDDNNIFVKVTLNKLREWFVNNGETLYSHYLALDGPMYTFA